jgi:type I restriction enzyme, S subunit
MEGWKFKKINETCEIGRGRVINQDELRLNPGIYPVYSSQSFNNGEMGRINSFDFNGEYVTWTTDGAYAGTVFFRQGKFNCTNVCGTLKPKNENEIDLKFLAYLLSTEAKKHVSYVGNPKLMNGVMGEIVLNIPTSLAEQTRIANILSTADEAIAHTQNLIAKYQRIKTGLMQAMLTKGIDEHGNIRSKSTHEFVVKNGVEVPKEWEVVELGEVVKAIDPQPDHRTPNSVLDGIPYLGISDIDDQGNIDIKKCRKVAKRILEEHNRRYSLRIGDIIFGKIGTIGEPKRILKTDGITISANVILLQPIETPSFYFWTLKSEYISTQVKNTIHSTTQPAFGMEKVRTLLVRIPSKTEREKIETIFDKSDLGINSLKKSLQKLQSLKTGLMQDLLSGRVRV